MITTFLCRSRQFLFLCCLHLTPHVLKFCFLLVAESKRKLIEKKLKVNVYAIGNRDFGTYSPVYNKEGTDQEKNKIKRGV